MLQNLLYLFSRLVHLTVFLIDIRASTLHSLDDSSSATNTHHHFDRWLLAAALSQTDIVPHPDF